MTLEARATPTTEPRLLRAGLVAAALGVLVLGSPTRLTSDPLPLLTGLAALCVVGLARRTAPTIAWLAATGAAFSFSGSAISASRVADPAILTFGPWLAVAVPAGVAAILTMLVATWFATRPERPAGRVASAVAWILFAWLSVAIVVTWVAVSVGQRDDPALTWIDVAAAPTAWYVPFVVVATVIGLAAEARWAAGRASERLPRAEARTAAGRWWALARATFDELVPGRDAVAEATAVAERRDIAGDLHAAVVPNLRRAIEEAEGGSDPAVVLRHLRAADLELDRLMTARWPIVLETFGLVAALEDLAERVEAEGGPAIDIDVDRSNGRPPTDVERVAWRVAQIALDNAVRHAAATTIRISIAVDAARVRLVVADDGRGLGPDATRADRGRGIPDAIRRASQIRGRTVVAAGPLHGTSVTFDWPAGRD